MNIKDVYDMPKQSMVGFFDCFCEPREKYATTHIHWGALMAAHAEELYRTKEILKEIKTYTSGRTLKMEPQGMEIITEIYGTLYKVIIDGSSIEIDSRNGITRAKRRQSFAAANLGSNGFSFYADIDSLRQAVERDLKKCRPCFDNLPVDKELENYFRDIGLTTDG